MATSTHEVENFAISSDEGDEITVDQFWEELCYDSKNFKQKTLGGYVRPKDHFKRYMNKISKKIHKSSSLLPEQPILFHAKSTTAHPTGARCRPEFSASPSTENEIQWIEIEATIGIVSTGMSTTEGLQQAISYTLCLLQARPDRISVQGMYVDDSGVVLIISSAAGIKKSPKLCLTDTSHVRLIHAFVKRLYDPHPSTTDPTITRRKEGLRWVFDITVPNQNLPSQECCGYRILSAPSSLGQRTHVFVNEENPNLFNNVPIPIIKDQYLQDVSRFDEAEVICHIHAEGEVPGVVHLVHDAGSVVSSGNDIKSRLCISERGTQFMDIKTPLEVLMAIYDLLEVTRFLYVKRQVLHRDISIGNVLHMARDHATTAPPHVDTDSTGGTSSCHKFCSINHFLYPSTMGYNSTSILLIDFNRGEILDIKDDEACSEQVGTPMFMARAVRKGQHLGKCGNRKGSMICTTMPRLSPMALEAYKQVFPDRLEYFQYSRDCHLEKVGDPTNEPWRHDLRHDAESTFWLLGWWAVLAFPEDGPQSTISPAIWSQLTETRYESRFCLGFTTRLHEAYSPLEALLRDLGDALEFDLHWATKEPYTHPEFLHEVFQRHILNFIFNHRNDEFMNKPKADAPRKPTPVLLEDLYPLKLCRKLGIKRPRELDFPSQAGAAESSKRKRSRRDLKLVKVARPAL